MSEGTQAGDLREFTRIQDHILEALSRADITARQHRVILAIVRKTYGFHKSKDWITASQLAEVMQYGGSVTHISADIRVLKQRNIVLGDGRKIGLNKHTSQWLGKAEAVKAAGTSKQKSDRNRSCSKRPKVTETGQKSDRNQSGCEKANVTGIGSPSDRNQSLKVTETGQHNREQRLLQQRITSGGGAIRLEHGAKSDSVAAPPVINSMDMSWRPSIDLVEIHLQQLGVSLAQVSQYLEADIHEFKSFWAYDRSSIRYSQQAWHCKLAERLAEQHRWRGDTASANVPQTTFDRLTDRSWATSLEVVGD